MPAALADPSIYGPIPNMHDPILLRTMFSHQLLHRRPVDASLPNAAAWARGCVLEVMGQRLDVQYNAPTVDKVCNKAMPNKAHMMLRLFQMSAHTLL